jgi:alkyldihydroxyacetonephosphate synthase
VTAAPHRDTKWHGWGDAGKRLPLSASTRAMLAGLAGREIEERPPPRIEEVELPPARDLPAAVAGAVGEENVLTGDEDRVRHSAGSSYPDLIRLRSGRLAHAPDAVLTPAEPSAVRVVLDACSREGVAVVPFGGGTSVVGGVDPVPGSHQRLVALDLTALRTVEVDSESLLARLGAGLRGPEAEEALAARGLTLGHFPQSFEYATIGGFAATRSAGQASSGYGRFDDLVNSLRMSTPAGELETLASPHTAAGPSLLELALGSEGALGVITEVTVRVRVAPEHRRHEGWMAADFESGAEIARRLAQEGALPDVIRVSDREETALNLAMSGTGGAARRAFDLYLRARRRAKGSMVIVGYEGTREAVSRRRALGARVLRAGGAAYLGTAPGKAWERNRYAGPYLAGRSPERCGGPCRDRGRPGSSSATSRTSTGTGRRSTSPSSPLSVRERSWSSGAPRRPRPRRRSLPRAARSPTTTRWAAITLPTCARRWGSWGSSCCAV